MKSFANENQPVLEEKKKTYHKLKEFKRSGIFYILNEYFVPLLLLICMPILSMSLWYICKNYKGSFLDFFRTDKSVVELLYDILFNQWTGDFWPICIITGNAKL